MSDLSQKILDSRKIVVEVGHMKFFARRLTWVEYVKILSRRVDDLDALVEMNLVSGWENVTSTDIFLDDTGSPQQFNRDLFNAAIVDMPQAFEKIIKEIVDKTKVFFEERDKNEKNLDAGSTKASGNKK